MYLRWVIGCMALATWVALAVDLAAGWWFQQDPFVGFKGRPQYAAKQQVVWGIKHSLYLGAISGALLGMFCAWEGTGGRRGDRT